MRAAASRSCACEDNKTEGGCCAWLRAENERLRARDAQREAELERVNAALAVLQRMVFGRSSEQARPDAAGRDYDRGGGAGRDRGDGGKSGRPRGPGARAGRDYSHLPRVEVIWDFPGGGYCCPQCGVPFTRLGDHVAEVLDWQVVVRLVAHCRRRYRRVPVPGPGDGDGARGAEGDRQGPGVQRLHRNAADRAVCGRAEPELAGDRAGPARRGGLGGDADRDGRVRRGAAGPAGGRDHRPSRASWHLHADETSWHVFAPREGRGPARWWLCVFLGPYTACFVMYLTLPRCCPATPRSMKTPFSSPRTMRASHCLC